MRFAIEIELKQLKPSDTNEIDLLIALKTTNYEEIVLNTEKLVVKFDNKHDFETVTELLASMRLNFEKKTSDSGRLVCPPPPPHLKYKYPPIDDNILSEICVLLRKNRQFYTQTLHLLNKFNIRPPESLIKRQTEAVLDDNNLPPLPPSPKIIEDDEDSEIEESMTIDKPAIIPINNFRRKSHLPKIGVGVDKRAHVQPTTPKRDRHSLVKKKKISLESVFEK